jgi:small GTP-binding protein
VNRGFCFGYLLNLLILTKPKLKDLLVNMKPIPTIALFGLPNSGKSTLLNRICGTKKAITAKEEHTTRDLNWSETEWDNMYMQFVDTGGLVPDPEDKIQKEIQIKSFGALAEADILVWVIDRRQNPENIPQKLLQKLWKVGKPFMVAVNKVDDPNLEKSVADYARLGGFAFVNVSATNSYGINTLLDALVEKCLAMGYEKTPEEPFKILDHKKKKRSKTGIVKMLNDGSYYVTRENSEDGPGLYEVVLEEGVDPDSANPEPEEPQKPKILLLGKPNVGKSSLFNAMVGTEIQIVTDIPGTTLSVNDTLITRKVKVLKKPETNLDLENLDLDSLEAEEMLEDIEEINADMVDDGDFDENSESPAALPKKVLANFEVSKSDAKNITKSEEKPEYEWVDKEYVLLDSTGIRKPGQRTTGAETFATFRTVESAYQADVICLVVDASVPVSHQDQVVAGICKQAKKGIVVIANKADLIDEEQKQAFIKAFLHKFVFLKLDDFVWVSAKNKTNLNKIWEKIDESLANREKQIDRAELRKLFNYLMKKKPPNKVANKRRAVIYDLIYSKSKPPTFELLIKDKTTVHWSYVRFLENVVRKQFNFQGTAISVKVTEVDRKKVGG